MYAWMDGQMDRWIDACMRACMPACLPGCLAGWLAVCLSVCVFVRVCVCQTLFLRAVRFLRFLRFGAFFSVTSSKQGDCLTCNSGSPTKRLLQVTEMDSGRRIHVPVLKCRTFCSIFSYHHGKVAKPETTHVDYGNTRPSREFSRYSKELQKTNDDMRSCKCVCVCGGTRICQLCTPN